MDIKYLGNIHLLPVVTFEVGKGNAGRGGRRGRRLQSMTSPKQSNHVPNTEKM